jgi:hypothetical protein
MIVAPGSRQLRSQLTETGGTDKNNAWKGVYMKNTSKLNTAPLSGLDETDRVLAKIANDFRKVLRAKALVGEKTLKLALQNEMNHVHENMERLIHGKA